MPSIGLDEITFTARVAGAPVGERTLPRMAETEAMDRPVTRESVTWESDAPRLCGRPEERRAAAYPQASPLYSPLPSPAESLGTPEESARAAVMQLLSSQYPQENADILVIVKKLNGSLIGPMTAHVYRGRLPGTASVLLRTTSGQAAGQEMLADVEVIVEVPAVILLSTKEKGQIIRRADTRLERVRLTPGQPLPVASFPEGELVAARRLAPGKPLLAEDVSEPGAVAKNGMVTVTARAGSIRIEIPAVALEDGRVGDVIQVANVKSSTSARWFVKVIAPGQAEFLGNA
jgi:flagella basal body P-ring formation protein FlgA